MYWLISFEPLSIALFLVESLVWALGGWLIVSHAFKLRSSERLLTGIGTGFILFIGLSNLYAHIFRDAGAYWSAAVTILLFGIDYRLALETTPVARQGRLKKLAAIVSSWPFDLVVL